MTELSRRLNISVSAVSVSVRRGEKIVNDNSISLLTLLKQNDASKQHGKNLKAEIDEEKIEAFKGTVSLPFEQGDNAKIAVKIIDDRGIESLRVIS